jgi:hypothetical protein
MLPPWELTPDLDPDKKAGSVADSSGQGPSGLVRLQEKGSSRALTTHHSVSWPALSTMS